MTEEPQALALGLAYLIKAEPTLLPVAPDDDWAVQIRLRTSGEIHLCLRCGQRARCAYIAETTEGPRWLDLCPPCAIKLRDALDEDARRKTWRDLGWES